MKLNTIYISVKNMKRALDFYRKLFQKEPEVEDKRFSYFNLDGFTFALYNPAFDKTQINWGENTVPCFQVGDIEKEF
ncbi:MAG: hypothetical protein KatS3mg090_0412 [Patescibacteria group bacterium]|nr:MAG: hypothetical protein KatS3mg090_0412 [Patescibacteria group bacterium]